MTRPTILFFARGYQADYFPTLACDDWVSLFVTLTRAEKRLVEARGQRVAACFEEVVDRLAPAPVPEGYLRSSFLADRFLGRFDGERRRDLLGRMIRFWGDLLDTHRPAAVVNELVAIEISEVLLIEAERRGIRYLAGMNCVVEDWFYWLADPLSLSGRHLALPEPSDRARELARAYVAELKAEDYQPFYVRGLKRPPTLKLLAAGLVRWLQWQARIRLSRRFRYEDYREEFGKRVEIALAGLWRRYDRLEGVPANREIIFYPLHQEPEATLNYMSTFFANQVATIENILKCLTPEQVLVVKEHPVDAGALLRGKFQKLRREASGLYYLPAEVHGREVLARGARVVTLTSTVGWEAAALGHPVYVLGEIFYDVYPGVTRVEGWPELRALLRAPARVPDLAPDALEEFVARMVEASMPGNPFPHDGLYSEANRERVLAAIRRALLG